jgi:hypothetical protein
MCRARWGLSLLFGIVTACSSPRTAIAPNQAIVSDRVGLNVRSIGSIAAVLLEPLGLRGLVATPSRVVRSDSGEQRIRQVLLGPDGMEALRVESTLAGSLRLIAQSGVELEGGQLSDSAAIAHALQHLMRLSLPIPGGGPAVSTAAGRTLLVWTRQVRGIPVPDDGTRVVLNGGGALVGLAIEESPLAEPPARLVRSDAALRAATALLPGGVALDLRAELAWVVPRDGGGPPDQRAPRRLAWCIRGSTSDGSDFEIQLDAGSLAPLGLDGAP